MIWGLAWMFWLIPLFFFFALLRGWRWAMGYGGCGRPGRWDRHYRGWDTPSSRQPTPEIQQSYVEDLERRIADLEEKLEFTERLVAERKQ
jgi:hypothetical protein